MKTYLEEIENTINTLEKKGFPCGKLTSKERKELHNLLNKSN